MRVTDEASQSNIAWRARARASGGGAAASFKVYYTWQELLDDDEINAVCIGTWPYMHRPLTLAALERYMTLRVWNRTPMLQPEGLA